MRGKVDRLALAHAVMLYERVTPLAGPVTKSFLVHMGAPKLDDRAVLKNPPTVVANRAAGGRGRILKQFFLRKTERTGGLEQDENMAGRLRRDQLFGNLVGKSRQSIVVFNEKRQVNVIGNRVQGDDFDRKKPPIFEETTQASERQRPRTQLGHESAVVDLIVPVSENLFVKIIDECLGVN